jgi:serine/threonine protein kinase
MVVSAQTILSSVTSLAKDLTPPCAPCLSYRTALLTCHRSQVIHGTHRATRQEYAIKVLDKGHLKRNNKLNTALAEKNTLVRLGSGHPGIVRLHWAFQDDWSLCESPLSLTSPAKR